MALSNRDLNKIHEEKVIVLEEDEFELIDEPVVESKKRGRPSKSGTVENKPEIVEKND